MALMVDFSWIDFFRSSLLIVIKMKIAEKLDMIRPKLRASFAENDQFEILIACTVSGPALDLPHQSQHKVKVFIKQMLDRCDVKDVKVADATNLVPL